MRRDLFPDALDQLRWQVWIDAQHARNVVRAQRTKIVDLPEVLPGREISKRAVHGSIQIGKRLSSGAGLIDQDREVPFRVRTKQVTLECIITHLLHRAPGEHVWHPGVVVGVIVDNLAQSRSTVRDTGQEALGHDHRPLVLPNPADDALERPVGEDEHFVFLHHRPG